MSQTITILEKHDTLQKPKYVEFLYLNDSTDLSGSIPVASISARGLLKDPVLLYSHIRLHAQLYGANAFKFKSFNRNSDDTGELVLSLFFCTDSLLGVNFKHGPKNSVYILGNQDLLSDKTQSFKVNKVKHEIKSGYYKEFQVPYGEVLQISKGGMTGMTVQYKGDGSHSAFYSFSGLGVAGAQTVISGNGQGIAVGFTTGKVLSVDPGLAMLLLKVFNKHY